ncbi:MAG: RNA 2',3'-cyclic phosphodiesterase [Candidatus Omnitrophica bacterium]|nr:RNA 2',3'-cyclic phosphodiesterase [Candidatus Omnitrophota bacterium]MCM8828216.1 RNA 2',3'-cyclic phosphodiesterase [Candidatus Omnitrophota bacterium]
MRIFAAIKIDNELINEISNLLKAIEKYKDKIKTVSSRNLHLTIRFLGEVSDELYPVFSNKLAEAYSFFYPFVINLRGVGFFPDKNRPRVIWVGVEENPILKKIYFVAEKAARDIGLEPENKFQGHITAGRVKSVISTDAVKNIEENFGNRFWGMMTVKEITIFKSILRPEGPEYKELVNIPIGGKQNG